MAAWREASMAHDTFLFVNTRAVPGEGVGGSSDRSAILSHAQARRRAKERRARAERQRTSPYSHKRTSEKADEGSHPTTIACTILLQQHPTGNGSDPFHCTAAGRDGSALASIKDGLVHAESTTFLAEAFAPAFVLKNSSVVTRPTLVRLQRCVEDPMLMYATLAFGSLYLAWMQGKLDYTDRPAYYMIRTLHLVRARLNDSPTQPEVGLMLSIHALAVTDMWNSMPDLWRKCPKMVPQVEQDRIKACQMHLRALCLLVDRVGGWRKVNFMLLKAAILVDKFQALYTSTNPIIPLTWDPGAWPRGDVRSISNVVPAANHQCEALIEAARSTFLKGILRDVADYITAADYLWSQPILQQSAPSWLFLRMQVLIYRLLLLPVMLPVEDQCIQIATLVFLLSTTNYLGAQLGALMLMHRLKIVLSVAIDDASDMPVEVVFWCACTAAMTSDDLDQEDWLLRLIARSCDTMGVDISSHAFGEKLQRYLYHEDRQVDALLRLVDRLYFQAKAT